MKILKQFDFDKAIIKINVTSDDTLALIDRDTTIRFLDIKNKKIVSGFKANISHKSDFGTYIDINDKILFVSDANVAFLFLLKERKKVYTLKRHDGDISALTIDPNGRFLVTCGLDGKTFVWNLTTARLAFSVPPHGDEINLVNFSEDGRYLITSSYDRKINITDTDTLDTIKIVAFKCRSISFVSINHNKILAISSDGEIAIISLNSGNILKRLPKLKDNPSCATISDDKKFLFIGTALGYVYIYDVNKEKLITDKFLKFDSNIVYLYYCKNSKDLYISLENGNLIVYDIHSTDKKLVELIDKKDYNQFYEKIEKNPLIKYSDIFKKEQKTWQDSFNIAETYLLEHKDEKAQEVLKAFRDVPSYNTKINELFKNFEDYELFCNHVDNEKYSLAYSLAKKHKSYEKSKKYIHMQKIWSKSLKKAQTLLKQVRGEDLARDVLSNFRGISEKASIIKEMFAQKNVYELFKKHLADKNYKAVFKLAEQHHFLKEFAEYHALEKLADNYYVSMHNFYKNYDYISATKTAKILINFDMFHDEALDIENAIKSENQLNDAYENHNLLKIFELIQKYPSLSEHKIAIKVEKDYQNVLKKALGYTYSDDIITLGKIFENYIDIKSKYPSIASVYSNVYITQLENAYKDKVDSNILSDGIKNYISMLGIDDNIDYFVQKIKAEGVLTKLNIKLLNKGSLKSWSPHMLVKNIMENR